MVEILDKNKVSYESKNQKLIFPVQNKVEELKEKINSKNTKDMQVLGDYYCKTKNNHEEMDKYLDKVINETKLSPKEVDNIMEKVIIQNVKGMENLDIHYDNNEKKFSNRSRRRNNIGNDSEKLSQKEVDNIMEKVNLINDNNEKLEKSISKLENKLLPKVVSGPGKTVLPTVLPTVSSKDHEHKLSQKEFENIMEKVNLADEESKKQNSCVDLKNVDPIVGAEIKTIFDEVKFKERVLKVIVEIEKILKGRKSTLVWKIENEKIIIMDIKDNKLEIVFENDEDKIIMMLHYPKRVLSFKIDEVQFEDKKAWGLFCMINLGFEFSLNIDYMHTNEKLILTKPGLTTKIIVDFNYRQIYDNRDNVMDSSFSRIVEDVKKMWSL